MFNRGPRPYHYRHRQHIRQTGLIAVTICCIPCICVVGACVLISQACRKIVAYGLPSTKLKWDVEREKRKFRRRRPCVLGPRLNGALTIGKEDENFGLVSGNLPGLGSKIVKEIVDGETVNVISIDREDLVNGKTQRKTDWQDQSGFFKLPLEIRQQIYEEAIGGYVFNIFNLEAYRRMSHTRWKATCSLDCTCRWQFKQPGVADELGQHLAPVTLMHLSKNVRLPDAGDQPPTQDALTPHPTNALCPMEIAPER